MLSENQMVSARNAAKRAVESTYGGVCSVIERRDVRDEKTKITRKTEVAVIENQPCKLSFERVSAAVGSETAAPLTQGAKLFVSPEITIKPGSKVVVTQNGVTTEYSSSGEPAVYFSHQEIMLELFKGWA